MLSLRNFAGIIAAVLIVFSSVGFGPPALIESNEAREPLFPYEVELAQQAAAVPQISAESAVIVDGATGEVLYAKNPHLHLAPASVTKIMTAILAIENGNLHDYVHVTVDGWAMTGSSIMGLHPGEVLTLQDLLYGLLLPSGNDAALAIAQYIGGSVDRFVAMMNQKAQQLGMHDTHFANPHGLDDPNHYSSAYDLAMLGRYAMQNPTFAQIVATNSYVAHGKATYALENGNALLGHYPGLDGVKTGFTDNAKQSYVASVERNGRHVFVSVMRSDDRYQDARTLFDYFFKNFAWMKLSLPQSPFFVATADSGAVQPLKVTTDRAEPLPLWEEGFLRSFVTLGDSGLIGAQGGTSGATISGSAAFYLGSEKLDDLPVVP